MNGSGKKSSTVVLTNRKNTFWWADKHKWKRKTFKHDITVSFIYKKEDRFSIFSVFLFMSPIFHILRS